LEKKYLLEAKYEPLLSSSRKTGEMPPETSEKVSKILIDIALMTMMIMKAYQ